MATGGRKNAIQAIHEISCDLSKGPFGISNPFVIGVLPRGAVLIAAHAAIGTPAVSPGAMTFSMGTTSVGFDLINALDLKTAARIDNPAVVGLMGPLAADTPIWGVMPFAAGPPTVPPVGVAWLEYLPGLG